MRNAYATDKRTDVYFIIWKINSGLWAVVWVGLWNKKGLGQLWATLEARFLKFLWKKTNQTFFWKYFRVRTEKLHKKKVNKSQKNFGKYFLFTMGKNLSVNTWRTGPDICSLICGLRDVFSLPNYSLLFDDFNSLEKHICGWSML